jgi:hypothetical protein
MVGGCGGVEIVEGFRGVEIVEGLRLLRG